MQCPGCSSFGGNGVVPSFDGSGTPSACPLCTPYGTPGYYPGGGVGYGYQIPFSLAALGQQTQTIQIRTSNDFEWRTAIATRTGSFSTLITVNQVQIFTVYNLAGNINPTGGVVDTNFWGTNANPFPLSAPIPLKADDFVTFQVVDLSNANNVISLFLIGGNYDAGTFAQPTLIQPSSNSGSGGTQ